MISGLQDRVALVTGASRGIGFAAAQALHAEGARVALVARNEAALKEAADLIINSAGSQDGVLAIPADVTDIDAARSAVERAHIWGGRLDVVVNCAGPPATPCALADVEDTVLAGALDSKLLGFLRITRAALPLMEDGGTGRIINVAGAAARTLIPNLGVVGITNAAVVALTSYLAAEAVSRHVLVNAISPGMTLTQGWLDRHEMMGQQQNKTGEEVRKTMTQANGIKLGRWARPEEIANVIVFLASDLSSYMTGQVLDVDGGLAKNVA
jgi:3-oxoacyl-[acyl-carrier protein] reductase